MVDPRFGFPIVNGVLQIGCACGNIRRAERAVTQFYDEMLKPSGVRITQLGLMWVISRAPGISQSEIGELLMLDSTTLTRTLASLKKTGWVRSERGKDRRRIEWTLTASGKARVDKAVPLWKAAQQKMEAMLGDKEFSNLGRLGHKIASVIPGAGGPCCTP
jgi:DNA-binding MarR family transcriptional regulator